MKTLVCSLIAGLALLAAHGVRAGGTIDLDAFDAAKRTVHLPNGQTLAYVRRGNPSGPTVVLVHGYTSNSRDWLPLLPHLSPRFDLVLVDLRGHGRSSKPECCYTRFDFAYDLRLLLDALHVRQADIVGHSLGSIVAQTFAEYWPERTRRVVLISSTAGRPPGEPPNPFLEQLAARIRALREPIDPNSEFLKAWWTTSAPLDPELLARQRRDAAAIPARVWVAILDQGIPDTDLRRSLPRLAAPVLLIWGSRDPIMDIPARETLQAALPQARVKVFEGLGHNPFQDDPPACAQLIDAFLLDEGVAPALTDPNAAAPPR